MASTSTLSDEIELAPAMPDKVGKALQFWTLVCGTAANTVAVTSAKTGLKTIYAIVLGGKNTTNVSMPVVQTKAGGAFTVLFKSTKTVYALVTGLKVK